MIRTNSDYDKQDMVQKFAQAIRHFRGYLDKEKFEEDFSFLMNFVHEVGPDVCVELTCSEPECSGCSRG